MADNKRIIYTIEVNDQGKMKVDGLTTGFVNASGAVKKLNQDLITQGNIMEDNSRKNQKMIDKTGLAGATLVELGRTVSDSNSFCGFRFRFKCRGGLGLGVGRFLTSSIGSQCKPYFFWMKDGPKRNAY